MYVHVKRSVWRKGRGAKAYVVRGTALVEAWVTYGSIKPLVSRLHRVGTGYSFATSAVT